MLFRSAAGVQWALEHPEASREELLEALLERVTGPDFPTGAQIVGRRGIQEAYRTGRGSFRVRANWSKEEGARGTYQIVVDQIPYQVQKAKLIERIAQLIEEKKLPALDDVRGPVCGGAARLVRRGERSA